jgi:VWFA-related protein
LTAALLAALSCAASAQTPSREILAGSGTLGSGIAIQYKTEAVGSGVLADSVGGGFRIEGDRLLRLLVDRAGRQYFGYQLAAIAAPNPGDYRVSIEPLDGFEDLLRRFAPDAVLRPAPAPKCPAPQLLREGNAIALDLMTSPDGRQRITDTIRLLHQTAAEVTTRDAPVTFKSAVNLVSVPVVVRDAQGRAPAGLTRDDFQLFDGGKPQAVTRFYVETPGDNAPRANLPGRFVAYVFDDLHFGYPDDPSYEGGVADMERARDAAWRQIDASLGRDQRAAIYTTSGQIAVDFTADRERLHKALLSIRAIGAARKDSKMMSFWEANQVENRSYAANLGSVAVAGNGGEGGAIPPNSGISPVLSPGDGSAVFAQRRNAGVALEYWNRDTHSALEALDGALGKLSTMPGRRSLVLVTPGFLVLDDSIEWETRIIDRAIRAGVVVNAVDVKGVSAHLNREIAADERAAMAEMTSGTGGRLVENSNDFDQACKLAAGTPENLYVLGFIPRDLKLDGHYHPLRVSLRNSRGLTVEARRGYYAPRYADTPSEQAKKQIEEAFFSSQEIHELPVAVETQFFKSGSDQATVDVLAKVDVKQLPFLKENGRNTNYVTIVSGLFDRDGNYVSGIQKVLELKLKDETLATRLGAGIAVRTSFDVKPGNYTVRTVARDSEGQSISALSSPMDIP